MTAFILESPAHDPARTLRGKHWGLIACLSLSACAAPAPRTIETASPPPVTEVYFYPTQGQSAEQQDRDRYACYLWAKKQTGFDPSDPRLAPHQRFMVVSPTPPGHDVAAGAVTGAVIGSVVARPGHSAEGAIVGAVAGSLLGAVSEEAQQSQAVRAQAQKQYTRFEQQAANYRRALTACLEGRGYSVR